MPARFTEHLSLFLAALAAGAAVTPALHAVVGHAGLAAPWDLLVVLAALATVLLSGRGL